MASPLCPNCAHPMVPYCRIGAPDILGTVRKLWPIKVEDLYENETEFSPSIIFDVNDRKAIWNLKLCSSSEVCFEEGGQKSLYLVADNDWKEPIQTKFKFGIVDVDVDTDGSTDGTTECHVHEFRHTFGPQQGWTRGCEAFIDKNQIVDLEDAEGKVTIFCEIQVLQKAQLPEPTLAKDMLRVFKSEKGADVTLVVGGEELKAHSFVLTTRSPVFEGMFKYNTVEKQTGRVVVDGLEPIGVKKMLKFMYTGNTKVAEKNAEKIFHAAAKYEVEELQLLCLRALPRLLTFENILEVLMLADKTLPRLSEAADVKEAALEFISSHSEEVAKKRDELEELKLANNNLFWEVVEALG